MMQYSRSISVSAAIIATVVVFYVLAVGKQLLVPFAVAVMLWYIINALSRWYAGVFRTGAARGNWLTLFSSVVTIAAVAALIVNMVQNNIADVVAAAPGYKVNLDRLIAKLSQLFGMTEVPTIGQLIENIDIAPAITSLATALTGLLGNIGLIVIYVAFLLVEQNTFEVKLSRLFPEHRRQQQVRRLLQHMQKEIQTYISIKTMISLVTGMLGYVILKLVGVDYSEFWAFTIFLLNFIPTIGSIAATLFPALLTLIQFDTFTPFVIVAVGLALIQFLLGNVIEPRLMGSTLNLSPLVVLLSLALWGSVWGVAGMFLCVPITVIALIVLSHFPATQPIAVLLSGSGTLKETDASEPAA